MDWKDFTALFLVSLLAGYAMMDILQRIVDYSLTRNRRS